jgi:hypothetical protein
MLEFLASRLFKVKKLHENKLIAKDLVTSNQWNGSLWSQK